MSRNNNGRAYKALKNFSFGLIGETITITCGLILPRLILSNYGSAYNGITHSIAQFISYIALMKSGIGSATRAVLYKPLVNNDNKEISEIIAATSLFMKKIAVIFIGFVIIFSVTYPLLVSDEFEWLFTASLVFIISISTFAEYYFGFTYQMLLMADQKQYLTTCLSIFTTILNTIVSVILINKGCIIHIVKLGTALVSCITPVFLYFYVRKKYNLIKIKNPNVNKVPQRWDAFAHEIGAFVNNNSSTVILTFFSNLLEVSVFTVYHYVTANLKKIVSLFTSSFAGAFGNMYAKNEKETLNKNFEIYELIVYSLSSILYSTTIVMVLPFVNLYTKGVSDINYQRPIFAVVLSLASAFECFRFPYRTMITVSGNFKNTKKISIIEAISNVVCSSICVILFGLNGISYGMLIAMIFGTINYALFVSKKIMNRSIMLFIKHIIITLISMLLIILISNIFMQNAIISNYFIWIIYSIITATIAIIITLLFDMVFYRDTLMNLINKIFRTIKGKQNEF